MSIITFLSDFGPDSYHTASFQGALFREGVQLPFLEISSSIEAFDIVEAAYLSSMVYAEFPEQSIHVLATNVVATSMEGHLAMEYNGHFFLAPDNGILPLIAGPDFKDYRLIPTQQFEQRIQLLYPAFISKLIGSGYQLDQIASKADEINNKSRLMPVKDEQKLQGTVLHVDHFGNAYTNISKTEFEGFTNGAPYQIELSRHARVTSVAHDFSDVKDGDALCFFSDHDHLVVAIKKGNAEQLLNLRKYKTISVEIL